MKTTSGTMFARLGTALAMTVTGLIDFGSAAPLRDWVGTPGDVAGRGVVSAGEAIWNDFLFDDYGANVDGFESGNPDYAFVLTGAHVRPGDPARPIIAPSQHHNRFRHTGDFGYPARDLLADPHGYDNVADIAEVRVAADATDLYFRVALTALAGETPTVIGVALDTDPRAGTGGGPWPFGAGLLRSEGWDRFLTVWGAGGAITTATDPHGSATSVTDAGGEIAVDLEENVIEVRVPRTVIPGAGTWRLVAAAGRWDPERNAWAEPLPSSTQGGSPGSLLVAPRIYDLAFNRNEPNSVWDETAQANALAAHRIDAHSWLVDVDALEAGVTVPVPCTTGVRKETQQAFLVHGEGLAAHEHSGNVNFDYRWKVQPYAIILPAGSCDPGSPDPSLDLFFHPGNSNHNVYLAGVEGASGRNNWIHDEPLGTLAATSTCTSFTWAAVTTSISWTSRAPSSRRGPRPRASKAPGSRTGSIPATGAPASRCFQARGSSPKRRSPTRRRPARSTSPLSPGPASCRSASFASAGRT